MAVVAMAAAAGCGNFSNEDLLFLEAMPTRDLLRVAVPDGALGTQNAYQTSHPVCAIADASSWKSLKLMSEVMNGGVDFLVVLLDFIRQEPPTQRKANVRVWGPWKDFKKGAEFRVAMTRTVEAEGPRFVTVIEGRRLDDATWHTILEGELLGHRASQGKGTLTLRFDRIAEAGLGKSTDPKTPLTFGYDYRDGARKISARAEDASSGQIIKFEYNYERLPADAGKFDVKFTDAPGNSFSLAIQYNAKSEGRSTGTVHVAAWNIDATWNECWDSTSCLAWIEDPAGVRKDEICGGVAPCVRGLESACPAL